MGRNDNKHKTIKTKRTTKEKGGPVAVKEFNILHCQSRGNKTKNTGLGCQLRRRTRNPGRKTIQNEKNAAI